ncbi:MAG: hypothetical protein AAGD35_15140 [Actinomycetota bacterium]
MAQDHTVRSWLGVAVVATERTTPQELHLATEAAIHAAGNAHVVVAASKRLLIEAGGIEARCRVAVSDGTWADGVRRSVATAPAHVLLLAPAAAAVIRERLFSAEALPPEADWTRGWQDDRCGVALDDVEGMKRPDSNRCGLPGPGSLVRVSAFAPVFEASPTLSPSGAAARLLSEGRCCARPAAPMLVVQGDRSASVEMADAVEWRSERLRAALAPSAWRPWRRCSRILMGSAMADLAGVAAAVAIAVLVGLVAGGLLGPGGSHNGPAAAVLAAVGAIAFATRFAAAGTAQRPGRWVGGMFDNIDRSIRSAAAVIGLPVRGRPRFTRPVASMLAIALEGMLLLAAWRTFTSPVVEVLPTFAIAGVGMATLAPLLVSLRVVSRQPRRRLSFRVPLVGTALADGRRGELVDVSVSGMSLRLPADENAAAVVAGDDGCIAVTINDQSMRLALARQHTDEAGVTILGLHAPDVDIEAGRFLQRQWLTALSIELRNLASRTAAELRAESRLVFGGNPALRVMSGLTALAIAASLAPPYPNAFAASGATGAGGEPAGFEIEDDWWVQTIGGTTASAAAAGADARDVSLDWPRAVVHDEDGNVYVADSPRHVVYRIGADGTVETYAGNGNRGGTGDGGPADEAELTYPVGLAWHDGALYIADYGDHRVRKVDADGVISTVIGDGTCRFRPRNNVVATRNTACRALDVEVDTDGNVLVAAYAHHTVLSVDTEGIARIVAGNGRGGHGGDGGRATQAEVGHPYSVEAGPDGSIYIGTVRNFHGIRKVDPNGVISTIAGQPQAGFGGDGGPATDALFRLPLLTLTDDGTLLVGDMGNHRIRAIDTDGIVTTAAGNGGGHNIVDGQPAGSVGIPYPSAVSIAPDGSWVVTDRRRVRHIDTDGITTTIAGDGAANTVRETGPEAVNQGLGTLAGIAAAPDGSYYVSSRFDHRIRRIAPDGTASVIAGTGVPGFAGDGGPAIDAQFNEPWGLELAADGTLYVADARNARVRAIATDGTITTVAGGTYGFGGDGGPATSAALRWPTHVAVSNDGSLYIAGDQRIRRIDPDGTISTVAGTGRYGFSGDGGPATLAQLRNPRDLAVGPDGTLWIADLSNRRLRKVAPDGTITTAAGDGYYRTRRLGGAATTASIGNTYGVTVDVDGRVWVAANGHVLRLEADGTIHPVVGPHGGNAATGTAPASQSSTKPTGIALRPDGTPVWISETTGLVQTLVTGPPAPTEVAISDVGSATATVSWTGIAQGDFPLRGYEVKAGGATYETTDTTVDLRGLKAGTTHDVEVRALVGRSKTAAATAQLTTAPDVVQYSDPIVNAGGRPQVQADGVPAQDIWLGETVHTTQDDAGNVYVSTNQNQIWKIDTDGIATVFAGRGHPGWGHGGFSGDGGPARDARLRTPKAIVWRGGTLYVADAGNHRIRAIADDGTITTIAGNGRGGVASTGQVATSVPTHYPTAIEFDTEGRLVIGTIFQVVRLEADGTLTRIMGRGQKASTGDGGPAADATINQVLDLDVGADGRIYLLEDSARVRVIGTDGLVTTIAGTGPGAASGDGGPATAAVLEHPTGIDVQADGTVLITGGARIRAVAPDGVITTVAGTGQDAVATPGTVDPSTPLGVNSVNTMADGGLLLAETARGRVLRLDDQGLLTVVGGSVRRNMEPNSGNARQVYLGSLADLAMRQDGTLFTSSTNTSRVWAVQPGGNADTVIGAGEESVLSGAAAAGMRLPRGPIAVATAGHHDSFVLAENRLLWINPEGTAQVVAGNGLPPQGELDPDGTPSLEAAIGTSQAMVIGPDGAIYFADETAPSIRKLTPEGRVSTVVGTGQSGDNGDGRPATATLVSRVRALAFDDEDRLLFADYDNNRIRRVEADGTVTTVAGTGALASGPDGRPATETDIREPSGVAVSGGEVYFTERLGHVRKIEADGTIKTIHYERRTVTDLVVLGSGSVLWSSTDGYVRARTLAPSTPSGIRVVQARNRNAVLEVQDELGPGERLQVTVEPSAPVEVRGNEIHLAGLDPRVNHKVIVTKADRFGTSGVISTTFRTTWRPETKRLKTAQVSAKTITVSAEIDTNGEDITSIVAVARPKDASAAAVTEGATTTASATDGNALVTLAEPSTLEAGTTRTVTATFSGLAPGKQYEIHFEATNDLGTTSTDAINATTPIADPPAVPSAPADESAQPVLPPPPPSDDGPPVNYSTDVASLSTGAGRGAWSGDTTGDETPAVAADEVDQATVDAVSSGTGDGEGATEVADDGADGASSDVDGIDGADDVAIDRIGPGTPSPGDDGLVPWWAGPLTALVLFLAIVAIMVRRRFRARPSRSERVRSQQN